MSGYVFQRDITLDSEEMVAYGPVRSDERWNASFSGRIHHEAGPGEYLELAINRASFDEAKYDLLDKLEGLGLEVRL